MFFLNTINYELANFIIGITIAVLSIIVATGVSIWLFCWNRKNYISCGAKKIIKFMNYVEKTQKLMRSKRDEEFYKNINKNINAFYYIEYSIMHSINFRLEESKQFISWKEYNVIKNLTKIGRKRIKSLLKQLNIAKQYMKNKNKLSDNFRIILFIYSSGIPFDLYGQFIDNEYLLAEFKNGIQPGDDICLLGLERPYNLFKVIEPGSQWNDINYNFSNINVLDKLSFFPFSIGYKSLSSEGLVWNLSDL